MMGDFLADCHRLVGQKTPLTSRIVLKLFFNNHGLKALFAYRLGRFLRTHNKKIGILLLGLFGWILYFLLSRYSRISADIKLDLSAIIGKGLYIGHFGNIDVRNCTIGEFCSISQSVHIRPEPGATIGPTLGDRVWVGAHAKIIGEYFVNSGCTVSAGAVVKRDLPENSLFMGNPARMVLRDYDNTIILGLNN